MRTVLLVAALAVLLGACGGPANTAPTADAGGDRTVPVGAEVLLDASASADADGDALRHAWTLTARPEGSEAALADAAAARSTLVPDVSGAYHVALVVTDGTATATAAVTITATPNVAPIADAGTDRVVAPGDAVDLDGTASSDADGDDLSYTWRFLGVPSGSAAALSGAGGPRPRFTADVAGAYRLELRVSDGAIERMDTIVVRANRVPSADAGVDAQATVGDEVMLNGTASSDPDGDALGYRWTLASVPSGSTAALDGATTPTPRFEADVAGDYLVDLEVSDGAVTTTDRVRIEVLPPGGLAGSTVHVATDGSDTGPGSEEEPVATLGRALELAAGNTAITSVRLAAGVYDAEPYGYVIGRDLKIVGPTDPATPAVLDAGAANLVEVSGDAFASFVRVSLRTSATAASVADDATLSFVGVACEADVCIDSGALFGDAGGRISVTDSVLRGTSSGIEVAAADAVNLSGSRIEGASGAGLSVVATPVHVFGTDFVANDVGVNLFIVDDSAGVEIAGGTFEDNRVGLQSHGAQRVVVRDVLFESNGDVGVQVDNVGGVRLESVRILRTNGDGLVVGRSASGGETVTVRDSVIQSNLGHGVSVHGDRSYVDLGTATDAGDNEVNFNKGHHLNDERPSGASGRITASASTFGTFEPAPGTYVGPGTPVAGIYIASDNAVVVHAFRSDSE